MMNKYSKSLLNMALIISMLFVSCIVLSHSAMGEEVSSESNTQTYIVHLSSPSGEDVDLMSWHTSFLPTMATGEQDFSRLVHSYKNVVSGFAAKLSAEEVKEMEKKDGFILARPSKKLNWHTTHSPNFLGLEMNFGVWQGADYGKGVIIGLMDSGITPAHPSFDDNDMPPPPAKWKGKCEFAPNLCNNKLIGARNFVTGLPGPPIDTLGHGTHTSSTAAGNFVRGANVFGMANGTAAGIAPLAHVAMYRVGTENGLSMADLLAGMDAAVEDGVDVMSLSLGGPSSDFFDDNIAIGAFGAIQKGVFVSCSAGNSGPTSFSLSNEAPWILTVGASTIDRSIMSVAVLGNDYGYEGQTLYQPEDFQSDKFFPLVDAGANGNDEAALCWPGSLDNIDVKGKVVLCAEGGFSPVMKGQTVKDACGIAMILANEEISGYSTYAYPHVLPASAVSYDAGKKIRAYINSTSTPNATIQFYGTYIGNPMDPVVTSFSSRGPNSASPGILKPDIIGPGVNILAAWPISVDHNTNEKATFNIISGTSMSCPHLSGIAALLKSSHPDWSPAAIKSAIMTSATQTNLGGAPIDDERNLSADIFALGAGHVNPSGANDPGLIYDLTPKDYISYMCGLGYTNKQIEVVVQYKVDCAKETIIPEAELNYPSFSIELGETQQTYTRTVTNVGQANSSYTVFIESIPGVNVSVIPTTLSFNEVNEKKVYIISFTQDSALPANLTYVQGAVVWTSNKHIVRSPISVKFV